MSLKYEPLRQVARIQNEDLPRAGKSSGGMPFLAMPRALGWNPLTGQLLFCLITLKPKVE